MVRGTPDRGRLRLKTNREPWFRHLGCRPPDHFLVSVLLLDSQVPSIGGIAIDQRVHPIPKRIEKLASAAGGRRLGRRTGSDDPERPRILLTGSGTGPGPDPPGRRSGRCACQNPLGCPPGVALPLHPDHRDPEGRRHTPQRSGGGLERRRSALLDDTCRRRTGGHETTEAGVVAAPPFSRLNHGCPGGAQAPPRALAGGVSARSL
jgi:hypothetical protein